MTKVRLELMKEDHTAVCNLAASALIAAYNDKDREDRQDLMDYFSGLRQRLRCEPRSDLWEGWEDFESLRRVDD